MDLQKGKLYWNTTFSNTSSYPRLEEDIKCDVLIIEQEVQVLNQHTI